MEVIVRDYFKIGPHEFKLRLIVLLLSLSCHLVCGQGQSSQFENDFHQESIAHDMKPGTEKQVDPSNWPFQTSMLELLIVTLGAVLLNFLVGNFGLIILLYILLALNGGFDIVTPIREVLTGSGFSFIQGFYTRLQYSILRLTYELNIFIMSSGSLVLNTEQYTCPYIA